MFKGMKEILVSFLVQVKWQKSAPVKISGLRATKYESQKAGKQFQGGFDWRLVSGLRIFLPNHFAFTRQGTDDEAKHFRG
jgi:hypothetical protein